MDSPFRRVQNIFLTPLYSYIMFDFLFITNTLLFVMTYNTCKGGLASIRLQNKLDNS